MPELPDVEIERRYLEKHVVGKTIRAVHIHNAKVVAGSTQALRNAGKNQKVLGTARRGKHLTARLASGKCLTFHFGMTGTFDLRATNDDTPKHARVSYELSGGKTLDFVCPRMFGRVGVADDGEDFFREKNLGPDALDVGAAELRDMLAGRKTAIKAALLDQSMMAGIGNIYADEALLHAGIDPRKGAHKLTPDAATELHRQILLVLKTAIKRGADPSKMPKTWLTPRRKSGAACPRCDGKIKKTKVGGRSTYYCPACQR
ncbi:DNA-formamidopyrimidine glycosylase [bacterium]|nr:DNA-formamidopyrimidine glycosylase [bacterium]